MPTKMLKQVQHDNILPPLFIGRFQPFHLGHLDAVRQILQRHKKVMIGIGSAQYGGARYKDCRSEDEGDEIAAKNPYSARLRARMMVQSLQAEGIPPEKFTLVKIPDIHDDTRWVRHVERLCPAFGEVWSGTPKVQRLFRKDGKHKVVRPKINVKISGTEIRRRIKLKEKWNHLVPKAVIQNLKM